MTLRPVPNATPYIACILAAGEAQDRLALTYDRLDAARVRHLTLDELLLARAIAAQHGYTVAEAADIVRRSRR